jgi:hypothetical protein
MVLAAEMSSGRIMPEIVSCLTSALVRTSWVPSMIRFPLGRIPVTTAATVKEMDSARFTLPEPELEKLDSVLNGEAEVKSFPGGKSRPIFPSMPNRLVRAASEVEVLFATEVFEVLAESLIAIWTVTMSPTRLALWSMKKARAPLRQRELAEAGVISGWDGSMPRSGRRSCGVTG